MNMPAGPAPLTDEIIVGNIELPKRVYFFQRRDGMVFSCEASEAYATYKKAVTFGFTYLGTSTGQTYYNMMMAEQARQYAILEKTAVSRRKGVIKKLIKDTLAAQNAARAAELEEAKKDLTLPPNDHLTVTGQRNSSVESMLSRIAI